ncbi:hypothetical protein DL798_26955 [Klebsiella pneumoniae]|nr:hypothetical protein DL798_26955 [Klebsiella pneumoniae]
MTVRVDWETGQGSSAGFPGFADEAKYLAWKKGIDAQKRQHSKTVPLPDKVTTSCWSPRNANYPIKEPVRMKEPAVCPK